MVASLSPNIQLKLEQTLLQWRHWRCDPPLPYRPRPISRLGKGLSNYSVLVEAERKFVIRIDGIHVAGNALSRSTEWRGLAMAHAAGLAPCPRYFNPELGVLVCDYLPPDSSPEGSTDDTAQLLRAIHALPALHHRLDLSGRILRYERLAEHHNKALPPELAPCRATVLHILETLMQKNDPQVFCHNDLLSANRIVSGGKMRGIDWEYCAMGNAWFDLAVTITGDALSDIQARELSEAYLQRPPTDTECLKLEQYILVYRYLEILWYLINEPSAIEMGARITKFEVLCQQYQSRKLLN